MMSIVHELRKARGGNAKMHILKAHDHNVQWKRILYFMYDSSINYYIAPPADVTFIDDTQLDYDALVSDLMSLIFKKCTGNAARDFVQSCSERHGEIFRLILGGSLKAGVSITSINKAYPGLIPTFPLMLAQDEEITRFPVLASTKYDGVRVVVRVQDGTVEPRTRSGKLLEVQSLMESMSDVANGVYDGELVKGDGLQESRSRISGDVNRVLKGSKDDISNYTVVFFDYLTLQEWDEKACNTPYLTRLHRLIENIESIGYIRSICPESLKTANEINEMYEDRIAKGYEGLILRYPGDPYVWRRSGLLIKKKAIKEAVLHCKGITDGTGKYQDMVGALLCSGQVEGKAVEVKVGSGLSDYDRDKVEDYYIGKRIEILYNDVVLAENSNMHSLFLPRFKRVLGDIDI